MDNSYHRPDINSNDQIDLGPVLNTLNRFLKKIIQGIVSLFKAALHYFWIVGLFLVLGGILGALLIYVIPSVYYSTMVITSTYLPPHYYHPTVTELNVILKDKNHNLFAEKLDIPVDVAEELKSIHLLPLGIAQDTILKDKPFRIVISGFDGKVFDQLTPPLINYLENTPYINRQKEIRNRQLQASIEMLENEMSQLDSLKKVMETSYLNKGNHGDRVSIIDYPDPVTVYQQKSYLFNIKQDRESKLAMGNNLQLINPFNERIKPTYPKPVKLVFLGILIGLLIGVIVAFRKYKVKT